MADTTYDVVIVGGGHNGIICGCYLAWAGLKVAVFEKEYEVGGGACSEEQPLPAFVSNPCANFTRMYTSPAWLDFKLWDRGARYIFPEVDKATIYDDGTCFVGYPATTTPDQTTGETVYLEENVKRSYESIARFSQRDADTYLVLLEKYQKKWREAMSEWRLCPPTPWGEKDAVEKLFDDPVNGIDPAWQFMTVRQVAYDLFESPELRILFMRSMLTSNGCFADDVTAVGEIIGQLTTTLSWNPSTVIENGTHAIAHALQKAFTELGGEFFVQNEVEAILVENGKAKGIRLTNGAEIAAAKAVVSGINVTQTFFRLLGRDYIDSHLARKIEGFSYDRANIHWAWFGLHQAPDYAASQAEPDCNKARKCEVMPKDLDYYISKYQADVFTRGTAKKLYMMIGQETLIDPMRVPKGKHNFLVEEFSAPVRFFTEKEWLQIKRDYVAQVMKEWQQYAPNMTRDNFIDAWDNSCYDTVHRNISMLEGSWSVGAMTASQMGRWRPCAELSGDRTPIGGLYLCNASQHYGGGLRGLNGYICYKVMAEDFGLPKMWETKGRRY